MCFVRVNPATILSSSLLPCATVLLQDLLGGGREAAACAVTALASMVPIFIYVYVWCIKLKPGTFVSYTVPCLAYDNPSADLRAAARADGDRLAG